MMKSPLRSRLRRGHPVWLETAPSATQQYSSLKGRHEADVAVVGGGMTGALVAAVFAGAGVPVHLVEAALIGRGSTAASAALLLQEPDQGLAQLAERYGATASKRIWQLSHEAVRDFTTLLKRSHIACDLVARDTVYQATTVEARSRLRTELSLRHRAGFEAEWLTPGALRRLAGTTARGALRTHGNAQFNPYKACVGLLATAAASGAEIFERSAVRRIDRVGGRIRIRTATGIIDAARVIIATGYATAQFRPLAGRFGMYHTYVLATPPCGEAERRELGLGNVMIWDTDRPYHYARWTADHRLLLGGGDRPVRAGQHRGAQFKIATRQLRDHFEGLLPALGDIGILDAWEGLFATTPDGLPYIGPHQRYPGHLFALGYGGNGMTFGYMAAQMLLEQWQGIRSPDQHLFRFGRFR